MKERGILMSAPMVRAILDGRKTQTRRLVKPEPVPFVQASPDRHALKHPAPYIDSYCSEPKTAANPRGMSVDWCWWTRDDRQGAMVARCPYGVPGDRLWVRETFRLRADQDDKPPSQDWWKSGAWYEADGNCEPSGCGGGAGKKRPAIFMPRWASRITLEVTDVHVQRVQEISREDCIAEGCPPEDWYRVEGGPERWYRTLWDTINGDRAPWTANPWVWVVSFQRLA